MTADGRLSWRDVRERVNGWVLAGDYRPGDKLPRDEDIAADLGCARSTVHRAMRDLAETGIIERRRKGGTVVRPDPVTRATLEIPVIRNEVEASGAAHGYRLIRSAVEVPGRDILARMETGGAERMLHVEALHLADGLPYIREDRWISLATVPEIAAVDLTSESANEWLVRNRPYSRCDLDVFAAEAGAEDAALFGVPPDAALLVIERTTWIDEAPITTVRAMTRPGYRLSARI